MRKLLISSLGLFCSIQLIAQSPAQRIEIKPAFQGNLISYLELLDDTFNLPLVYSPSNIPDHEIYIASDTYSIEEALNFLLDFDLLYENLDNQILIKEASNVRISGYIRDVESGEVLIGASVLLENGTGTYTNSYGYYSIVSPKGTQTISVRYVGFSILEDTIRISRSQKINYSLSPELQNLDAVVVHSKSPEYHVSNKIPGEISIDYRSKGRVPYFLGEIDVLQELLLLPGIRSLGEDAGGLNVRGGASDQNLIMVDEAPIYNPYHFFGLISVINPEAVNQVNVMKGFVPPAYGGRASSVINIYQREGNNQSHHFSGGIGLVSARFLAEGPLQKNKSSYLLSARQSLLGLSLNAINKSGDQTRFLDLNGKINWRLDSRNTLYLSGYLGGDQLKTSFDERRVWGNATLTLRWNHTIGKNWFMHLSGVVSDYTYRITNPVESGSFIGKSNITDYVLKWDNQLYYKNSLIEFGTQGILHRLKPGERLPIDEQNTSTNPVILESEQGVEFAGYISHELPMTSNISMMYGVRASALWTLGPKTVYTYGTDEVRSINNVTDTTKYHRGQTISLYHKIEPRLSLNFAINRKNAIKASYSRNTQYIHLLAANTIPSPTDIWKLSDKYIPPLLLDQFSIGFYRIFNEGWKITLEGFYKNLTNLIDYQDGADLLLNPNPETVIITGSGQALGTELLIEKTSGTLQGWISYTFSRTLRQFDQPNNTVNNGKAFPDYHDKPHDISTVLIYQLTPRISSSISFNYSSGRPITFPSGKYQFNNTIVPYFEGRNQDRISDYHRLDLSVTLQGRSFTKKGQPRTFRDFWTLSIYNLYARKNAYSYFFRQSEENPQLGEVVRYSVFGTIIPSITYNFKF
jgi:hypothetical protein